MPQGGSGGGGSGGMGLMGGGGGNDQATQFATMRQPPHQFQAPTIGQLSFVDAIPSLMAYAKLGQAVGPGLGQFLPQQSFLPPPLPEPVRPVAPPLPVPAPVVPKPVNRNPTIGEGRR